MQNRWGARVRSQMFLLGAIALVGAGLPALPAAADDDSAPAALAAPRALTSDSTVMPTDQFIVKFKERAGIQSSDMQSTFGLASEAVGIHVEAVRTTGSDEEVVKTDRILGAEEAGELVAALASDPNVEYAEPDTIMRTFADQPNDTYYDSQGMHAYDSILGAWDVSRGEGVNVAVVDSGILDHSDLNANVLPGYDLISSAAVARDGNGRDPDAHDKGDATSAGQCAAGQPASPSSWHGTHVAGIVAAVAGNNKGVAGVAPKSKVVPVRVMGSCGGYKSDIVDGIVWAAGGSVPGVPQNANPARVINVSIGGREACTAPFQSAVDKARSLGAVVVVAAGNENINASLISPANCRNVITVGAIDIQLNRAYYSNYGLNVDLVAFGGDIRWDVPSGVLSTLNDGLNTPTTEAYYYGQGTSLAAPQVAGVAAMMFSAFPALTPGEVEQKIKATANTLWSCLDGCGGGLLNADQALRDVAADAAPIGTGEVSVVGGTGVGAELKPYVSGPWADVPRIDWSYQWLRNGTPIAGATNNAYELQGDDLGARMSIKVTAKKMHFDAVTVTSAPTALVELGSLSNSPPATLEGEPFVGMTLTGSAGEWWPQPDSLTYQWLRDGQAIQGATALTYTLVEADAGKAVSFSVTATRPFFVQTTVKTEPTPKVMPADHVVTPSPIQFVEAPYMVDDKYVVPVSPGVDYQIAGMTIKAGTYSARGQVKIRAIAKPGYLVAPGAKAEWTVFFSTKGSAYTAPAKSPFKDVLTSQQFYKEMSWLAERKISTGWVEADMSVTYRPLTPINRDAMAAFLYRMAGSPDFTPPAKSPFKDVLTTQQFYKEMAWLAQTGVSSGWTESDGSKTYRPLTPISRDAMAAFLYRLAGSPDYVAPYNSPFEDVSVYQQFYTEMAWMSEKKISSGWTDAYGGRTYRPLSPINRDAMAAFLYRMP